MKVDVPEFKTQGVIMDRAVGHQDTVNKQHEKIRTMIFKSNSNLDSNYVNKLTGYILKESKGDEEENLPLILSVFYTESKFDHEQCSHENACGIGQLTPIAEKLYKEETSDNRSRNKLKDNIVISVWLIKYLKNKFGSKKAALAFYNGGYRQMYALRDGKPLARETRRYLDTISRKESEFKRLL